MILGLSFHHRSAASCVSSGFGTGPLRHWERAPFFRCSWLQHVVPWSGQCSHQCAAQREEDFVERVAGRDVDDGNAGVSAPGGRPFSLLGSVLFLREEGFRSGM